MDDLWLGVLQRTLIVATPLLLATIGEIVAERSGVLNLGVEGMMAFSAVTGFIVASTTGDLAIAATAAVVVGAFLGLVHAFVSVTLRANQVVSGLALAMLGIGLAGIAGKAFVGKSLVEKIEPIRLFGIDSVPFLGNILRQDVFFFLAIVLAVAVWFFLSKTLWGIKIRSVGENPQACDAQGVNVVAIKYLCVVFGGALAGLAGAQLSLSYSSSWIEGLSGGRGWIVIALTIFALWSPLRAVGGAILFGGIFVLQYLLQPLGLSPNLLAMLPYLTTLAVLLVYGLGKGKRKMNAPAMLAEVFKRGER